jgi:hypothetical protein
VTDLSLLVLLAPLGAMALLMTMQCLERWLAADSASAANTDAVD